MPVVNAVIKGVDLTLATSNRLFSPRGVDRGTLAMLQVVDFRQGDRVLDLGCGYGVVGIVAAKILGPENVVMVDIDEEAVSLARENAAANGVAGVKVVVSDGVSGIDDTDFTLILSNPPYHADFSVAKRFIEKGFNRLAIGGRLCMVTKRKEWYKRKLISIFGGVRITEQDGYWVFVSEKKSRDYAKQPQRHLSGGGHLSRRGRLSRGGRQFRRCPPLIENQ